MDFRYLRYITPSFILSHEELLEVNQLSVKMKIVAVFGVLLAVWGELEKFHNFKRKIYFSSLQ